MRTTIGTLAAIAEILNKDRAQDTCNCSNCSERIAKHGAISCETCGYSGLPVSAACACYDSSCAGGDSRGAGCFHGGLYCPVCDGGGVDAWQIIREIRQTIHDTTP